MTYEEMKSKACVASSRSKPKNEEHKIQCSCVSYFRLKYPHLRNMLFAVPNTASNFIREKTGEDTLYSLLIRNR